MSCAGRIRAMSAHPLVPPGCARTHPGAGVPHMAQAQD